MASDAITVAVSVASVSRLPGRRGSGNAASSGSGESSATSGRSAVDSGRCMKAVWFLVRWLLDERVIEAWFLSDSKQSAWFHGHQRLPMIRAPWGTRALLWGRSALRSKAYASLRLGRCLGNGRRRATLEGSRKENMAAPKKIICPSCGWKHTPPIPNNRCVSCGAKIEDLRRALNRQEELERRYQQEGFSLAWFAISIGIMTVLTAALVMGLPEVVPALDFEGSAGMLVSLPVWLDRKSVV